MPYVYSPPTSPSFTGKGLSEFRFGSLNDRNVDICYIDVSQGHDTFQISRKIGRFYYVLSGSGYFTIGGHQYNVVPGMIVEVPPKIEYSYSGAMKLIAFAKARWFPGNDTPTKWNADVVPRSEVFVRGNDASWLTRLVRLRLFGKSPVNAFLRLNQRVWNRLPSSLYARGPIRSYGTFLHRLARMRGGRAQFLGTFFLRNRPALELVRRLVDRKSLGDTVRVAVLGCSAGAEVYSVAWRIRSTRPDLKLLLQAMDISRDAVEFAKRGLYSLTASKLTGTAMLERMTAAEIGEIFERDGDVVRVKSCIKEGVNWHVGDVGDPGILDVLGLQDIVLANNFLLHMDESEAERCLRNIARLVAPQGYLLVSGVDLDVRAKVACHLGWKPVQESLEEIHEGDSSTRSVWPFSYAGLEPLNKSRQDWRIRYAAVFQIPPAADSAVSDGENQHGHG
jgi:chemotaxis methyl-accepting protein methylase